MSHANRKLAKRVKRLEDRNRRDMARLRDETIRAVQHILEEYVVDLPIQRDVSS